MPEFPVSVILNAVNNTKTALNEVKSDVEEMSRGFSGLEGIVQGVVGALSAYAGSKGLMGMIDASVEANRTLVQSRFFLKGMGGDVEANISTLRKWGSEIQRDIGINDEFAVLVASRLAPRFKDLNKIQAYATTLLKGHRIGVLDAESASIMLMRAADGNARAMTWLAYQLGITVHEFESMDSIMAKIQARLEGLTDRLDPFDRGMAILKASFSDFMEIAGAPFVMILGWVLEKINQLIGRFPILGDIIAGVFTIISTALLGLGFGLALDTILKFIGITGVAFGPWGLVIGTALGSIAIAVYSLRDRFEELGNKMKEVLEKPEVQEQLKRIKGIFEEIKNKALELILQALEPLKPALEKLKESALGLWEALKELEKALWKLWEVLAPILIPVLQFLGQLIGLVLFTAFNVLIGVLTLFISILTGVVDGITLVVMWVTTFIDWLADLIKKVIEVISSQEKLKEEFLKIWNAIKNEFKPIIDAITGWIDNVINIARRAKEAVMGIPSKIGGAIGGLIPFQHGGYIPETGPYLLHRGEYVVPAGGGRGGITLTITGNTFLDEESAVRMGDLIIKVLQRNIKL